MTTPYSTDEPSTAIDGEPTSEQVLAFLRRHPDFIVGHLDLIPLPPSRWQEGDKVVDLQALMVERLREELDSLRGCTDEILTTSRTNMSAQARVHRGALAMIAAPTFADLCRVVAEDLPPLLDIDVACLCLEPGALPADAAAGRLDPGEAVARLNRRLTVLRANIDGDPRLYRDGAGLVRSEALIGIDLGQDRPQGLLALGVRDPHAFHPGQGTELLAFLANVAERCLKRWLPDPA